MLACPAPEQQGCYSLRPIGPPFMGHVSNRSQLLAPASWQKKPLCLSCCRWHSEVWAAQVLRDQNAAAQTPECGVTSLVSTGPCASETPRTHLGGLRSS